MNNFPSMPGQGKHYQNMVFVFTIIWLVVNLINVSTGFYFLSGNWLSLSISLIISLFICATSLALNHLGYARAAGWSLTILTWLNITIPCYSTGGINAPGIISQLSVILTAGFLTGWRGGLVVGLLSTVADLTFARLEINGQLPEPAILHNPGSRWIYTIIPAGTILTLQYYATRYFRATGIATEAALAKEQGQDNLELRDYKFALDVASIISITGKDGCFTFVNENFSRVSGYSAAELLGKHHSILWSGYHSPEYFDDLKIAMQDGKPFRGEFCNAAKDGSLYWVDSTIVPFLDKHGNPYQYLSINQDITNGKVAQEKIKQSEERYRSIITVSNAGAWEYNWDTNQVWYSAEYFAMLGINRPDGVWDESMETTWIERLHPEDRDRATKIFEDYLKSDSKGLYESFFRMRHENGNWVWIWSRGRRLRDVHGNLTSVTIGSHMDITERKNAEEKIKQSEQLLRKITSHIPCNTYMFEIEESGKLNMLFMNRGDEAFNHNHSIDDFFDNPQKIREKMHDEDKVKFNHAMKEAYKTQSMLSVQYRIPVNGHFRWRWFQAVPERNVDGKIAWYGATSDITPLVEYIASIEQMIFDISHVIRRPISTMLGITRLISDSDFSEKELKDFSQNLYLISKEMDDFIQVLNHAYNEKKENIHIDFSSSVDKRDSLFK